MLNKSMVVMVLTSSFFSFSFAHSAPPQTTSASNVQVPSSDLTGVIHETFNSILQRMSGEKKAINEPLQERLKQRYDLIDNPSKTVKGLRLFERKESPYMMAVC
ncbi:hypothetical protein OQJ13_09295 [Legionella sp. PATHC035]|uniref:hypothetical protein n=1 Tax=Legionella sp. PATHC035 TaxID=2992040 RepID=UPI002244F2F4|nr:hypothetical protein [Legionella sp. PATHC035]MCW8409166.1 hypothetical protein [Legionella sp. PATHC035]